MRVLVPGGAGVIGSAFGRRLRGGGHGVAGGEHEAHHGDIPDPEAVAQAAAGCSAIVNFAAETHVDRSILGPQEFVYTDVLGTMTLLEWARSAGARYVQVSTD